MQHFEYETDELKNLDGMLTTVVKMMFPEPNDGYHQLWVRTEKPSSYCDHDHYYRSASVVQVGGYDGKKWCVVIPDGFHAGAPLTKIASEHHNYEAACKEAYEHKKPGPSRLFVCMVGNRRYGMLDGDKKFSNHEQLIWEVLCQVRATVANKKDEIHALEHPDEEYGDGSTDLGYRLHVGHEGSCLYVSIVKIYYSK